MAILKWTGPANAVTSDIVNDWSCSAYTSGNFFIGGVNVIAAGASTPAANTGTDLTQFTGSFGASLQNAIVMIWTADPVAQNGTLDMSQAQLEHGAACGPFARRRLAEELGLCRRYFEPCPGAAVSNGVSPFAQRISTNIIDCFVSFKVPKRATPTLVTSTPSWVSTGPGVNNQIAF